MRSSRGEFSQGWDRITGWGRGVTVRSMADLGEVRRFVEDRGDFRRAVMLQNVTASERRDLVASIEQFGVELIEFTADDKKIAAIEPTLKESAVLWGVLALSLPFRIVLFVQGRRSVMFAMNPRPEESGTHASRASED